MAKYTRILSIDGGGIRGIIPAKVLMSLEKKIQQKTGDKYARVGEYFDLVAGTSTGGILACALLIPGRIRKTKPKYSADGILYKYIEQGPLIFDLKLGHQMMSLNGLLSAKYPYDGLEAALVDYFHDLKLDHLLKPTLITAYDVDGQRAFFFRQQLSHHPTRNFYVRDICKATSAAPTYFPVAQIYSMNGNRYCMINGGVFASNPALCAYADARQHLYKKDQPEKHVTAIDMVVLSIGTGHARERLRFGDSRFWTMSGWTKQLMSIMMTGQAETVDYQLRQIYDSVDAHNQYLRINLKLPQYVEESFDNASLENIEALKEFGSITAAKFDSQLDDFVDLLLEE